METNANGTKYFIPTSSIQLSNSLINMKIKNRTLLTVAALVLSNAAIAQIQDTSATTKLVAYVANKFPVARTLNFEFNGSGAHNFTSKLRGTDLPEGRTTRWVQTRASANINLLKSENWILGTTFTYRGTSFAAKLDQPVAGLDNSVDKFFHYHASTLNLTHISRLFNKTAIYSGSFIVDGSEKQFERVKGLFSVNIVLKSNSRTRLAVGAFAMLDPSADMPMLPSISYEHHFDNGLIADITFPRNVFIRKNVFRNGRITLGTEIDRTGFYLYHQDDSGKTYEYRQVDLNNGLIYEHLVSNYFILTLKGGIKMTSAARVFDRNESFGDFTYESKPDATPYFSMGVSFNPFAKKKQ